MNANYEQMVAKYGKEDARKRMEEIRDIGGFGNIQLDYVGGLDVFSALDPTNTVIPEKTKERIAKLAGVSRKEVDRKITDGETFAGDQFQVDNPGPGQTKAA